MISIQSIISSAVVFMTITLDMSCRQTSRYHYPSDLEQAIVNGPVTRMQTLLYEMSDSSAVEALVQETIELFNEHGSSPSDTINYIKSGEQEVNVLYFNPNTSLREKQTFINDKLTLVMRCEFLPSGRAVRVDFANGSDSLLEYYLIDGISEKGQIDSARHFSSTGILLETFKNIHKDFTCISARNFDAQERMIYCDTVEVNEHNRPVREIIWMQSGQKIVRDTVIHHYDSFDHYGNWRVHTVLRSGQKRSREVRSYTYNVSP